MFPVPRSAVRLNAVLALVALASARTPLKETRDGMLDSRVNVAVAGGTGARNICGARCGFIPVLSFAAVGNVPSGRKLSAEENTTVPGASVVVS